MPVKEIVTKYVACDPKNKKVKSDTRLIKDPVIGKVTTEVATYKKRDESREIDTKGFKVTTIELGSITMDMGNHFFKFSTDHMLM